MIMHSFVHIYQIHKKLFKKDVFSFDIYADKLYNALIDDY